MAADLITFRDNGASIYQSMVSRAVRDQMAPGAPTPGPENGIVRAAAQVALLQGSGQPVPVAAPANLSDATWTTARLAYELLQAKLDGDAARAAVLADELKYGKFDFDWAQVIESYVGYFGADGGRKVPHYIAASPGMPKLPLKAGAVVALISDWGTGTATAAALLDRVAAHNPDVVIHLGDIYYSGTPDECDRNFAQVLNAKFDRSRVPVYNMSGNHDMYCGGVGYYGLLKTLNPAPLPQQPASFFCLRSADQHWQFLAMDTGRTDYTPLTVTDVLVDIDPAEEAWLAGCLADFPGRTILLSHHQFCSAFLQIGPYTEEGELTGYNPNLERSFKRFAAVPGARIAAWFWGHEHTLTLYAPYRGVAKGRCIGHGGVPVLVQAGGPVPLSQLTDPPRFQELALGVDDHVYTHGFVILRLAEDGGGMAEYYQASGPAEALFTETL